MGEKGTALRVEQQLKTKQTHGNQRSFQIATQRVPQSPETNTCVRLAHLRVCLVFVDRCLKLFGQPLLLNVALLLLPGIAAIKVIQLVCVLRCVLSNVISLFRFIFGLCFHQHTYLFHNCIFQHSHTCIHSHSYVLTCLSATIVSDTSFAVAACGLKKNNTEEIEFERTKRVRYF